MQSNSATFSIVNIKVSFQLTYAFVMALFLLSRDKTIHDSYFIIVNIYLVIMIVRRQRSAIKLK